MPPEPRYELRVSGPNGAGDGLALESCGRGPVSWSRAQSFYRAGIERHANTTHVFVPLTYRVVRVDA